MSTPSTGPALPFAPAPSASVAGRTLADSKHQWRREPSIRGVRFNRFHTTAICSPTRAALLTGRNHHAVGFGQNSEFASDFDGSARIERSVQAAFTASDTFDVGTDLGSPVALDYHERAPFGFKGTIERIHIAYV